MVRIKEEDVQMSIGTKITSRVRQLDESLQSRLEVLNNELARILDVLINKYNPQKVILFGSLVEGKVHEFSDIDLIVIKESDKPFYERLEEVVLLTMPEVGVDILVYTPEEFKLVQTRLFFEEEVLRKGKVIYSVH